MENLLNYLTSPIILMIFLGLVCVLLGRAVKIGVKHRDTYLNMEISGRDAQGTQRKIASQTSEEQP